MINNNEILTSNEFWWEIDLHIDKTADDLIFEIKNKKVIWKINSNKKVLCTN